MTETEKGEVCVRVMKALLAPSYVAQQVMPKVDVEGRPHS